MLEVARWGVIAAISLAVNSRLVFWLMPGRKTVGMFVGDSAFALRLIR